MWSNATKKTSYLINTYTVILSGDIQTVHERLLDHEKLLQKKTITFQGKEHLPKHMPFDKKKIFNVYLIWVSSFIALFWAPDVRKPDVRPSVCLSIRLYFFLKHFHLLIKDLCISNNMPASIASLAY